MITHTYPLKEAGPELRTLVQQARSTRQPVVLTAEETAQPIAVVLEMDAFEQTQYYQQRLLNLQLMYLENWLDNVEQRWDDNTVHEGFVNAWKENIKSLWDISPEPLRKFAASLILSVQKLTSEQLTREQISALRYSLALFNYPQLDEAMKKEAYQKLIDCGLPPRFVMDKDVIHSYIEES